MIRCASVLAIVLCSALPVWAQDGGAPDTQNLPAPASITYVDGEVQYLNAGAAERADAPGIMVNDGDGVRTSRGRAELVFGDGSVLHLADNTAVDVLGQQRLRLLSGRIIFRASASATDGYVIDTPAASVHVESRGEYNVAVDGDGRAVDVAVARGVAQVGSPSDNVAVRAGEEARLDGPGDRPVIRAFNSARLDAFERWSLTRYEGEELSPSSRRLPTELRAYGDVFDQYGRWDNVAPYGQVWYPSVSVGWRPYYNGSWRNTRYGWTWYGSDRWAWPTHHYGRWQYSGNVWFWVPARVWGPAWVSWAYAPGYVSWSPLGWDSRPVIPFYLRAGYANPDRWRGWTVLPRGYLGNRGPIQRWAVDGHRIASTGFVQQALPPQRGYAVRRDAIGGSASGPGRPSVDRAVPRGTGYVRSGGRESAVGSPASGAATGSPGAVVREGSAVAAEGRVNGTTEAQKRNPWAASPRGPSRTFEEQWGGTTRPNQRTPSAQPSPSAQPQPQSHSYGSAGGAVRRQDAPAHTPSPQPQRTAPDSRPRWEGPGPNDVNRDRAEPRGESRSPRYSRPEFARPASARPESARPESSRPESSSTGSSPRAEGARSRGESSGGGSAGSARGGSSNGGSGGGSASGSERSGGGRSGGVRRPPK